MVISRRFFNGAFGGLGSGKKPYNDNDDGTDSDEKEED